MKNRNRHNTCPTFRGWSQGIVISLALLMTLLCLTGQLFGQKVSSRLSSREAWIGSPVVLQIQISNAQKYTLPDLFEIDGCDVRAAGTPSQSSQITIYNGRRSQSRSVTMQYLITPQREGDFQIPKLEVSVDGKPQTTQPMKFVATKSETGDLLFVEVEGNREKVYVGEPLDLKLKLWIKPFVDRGQQVRLNEGHMWQMISEQTSWGAFTDQLLRLTENQQRPNGKTVLRKDAKGRHREYYLYEIEATVYPNKPGEIDASDLQMVVNYPQALGRSRDPFASFFGGGFGSPFGRRLSVSKSRPVVAEVNVDSTQVLAVPAANRPSDYRGAVGKYQIITDAEPTSVSAGDPITLKIGIAGDGPMELVQAPPLHNIESLTNDFQVTDQSLAGFVQNETKVFVTTIRPKSPDVKQIPAIPFSFFDPEKETYETVYSTPIPIEVEQAESLDMNSIISDVATANPLVGARSSADTANESTALPRVNLQNDFSMSLIDSRSPKSSRCWWYCVTVAPICWLVIVLGRVALALPSGLASLKSTKSKATQKIHAASEASEFVEALREYVARRTKSDCPTYKHAAGELRSRKAYDVAAKLESFCEKRITQIPNGNQQRQEETIHGHRRDALELLDSVDQVLSESRQQPTPKASSRKRKSHRSGVTASMIGLIVLLAATPGLASEKQTPEKLQTILEEANSTYQAAEKLTESQPAKAREMFVSSARRYQLLVDEGVRNGRLFLNLGNAWYRGGDQTRAILNYHRTLWMDPDNSIARQNLRSIEQSRLADTKAGSASAGSSKLDLNSPDQLLSGISSFVDQRWIRLIFAGSSVIFWLLLSYKTLRPRSKILKWSVVPFLIAVASGAATYQLEQPKEDLAVVVDEKIELKSGDGHEFQTEASLNEAAGKVASIIDQRADWRKVQFPDGQIGWLPKTAVERILP